MIQSHVTEILLILAITLSSPIMALHMLFTSPLPHIPSHLFTNPSPHPDNSLTNHPYRAQTPSTSSTITLPTDPYWAPKSASFATIVEGRRSGDVWLQKGDAVDGLSKVGRMVSLMKPLPRLAVLPSEAEVQDGGDGLMRALSPPPRPISTKTAVTEDASFVLAVPDIQVHDGAVGSSSRPVTMNSAYSRHSVTGSIDTVRYNQEKKKRYESKASSYYSAYTTDTHEPSTARIVTAQRHTSRMAMTVVITPSPTVGSFDMSEHDEQVFGTTTATEYGPQRTSSLHSRSRSDGSVLAARTPDVSLPTTPAVGSSGPPPALPLPPTPPASASPIPMPHLAALLLKQSEERLRSANSSRHSRAQSHSSSLHNRRSDARSLMVHSRAASISTTTPTDEEFSFGPIDSMGEIDELAARVLPLLVPGLRVGGAKLSAGSSLGLPSSVRTGKGSAEEVEEAMMMIARDLGLDKVPIPTMDKKHFSETPSVKLARAWSLSKLLKNMPSFSPDAQSTPAGASKQWKILKKKSSGLSNKNHLSLPS